jgi:hypothetical protein
MIDFRYRELDVHWNGDHSQPSARIYQLEIIMFVREEHGQSIASSKPVPAEGCSNASNTIMKLSEGRARRA